MEWMKEEGQETMSGTVDTKTDPFSLNLANDKDKIQLMTEGTDLSNSKV